ncbi:MAG: bifunctional hydroxymethylpyrimidine kinase/phosphomethylpyrimidine kinase [Candidatus Adiutrix sp.]|jgi:hydroxymethylpyrimidine/phosphomethylpyrimidine kinase|nr:bifunctional hydroxymethylpyrimidine kinase/phosphomethylpyrimidine kinase [Candidatus Adiutrix sp.]
MSDRRGLSRIPLKHALTIAASDSGAGAGIQADLKTFAAHRVYGLCVMSAVTAQNTTAVTAMECLSPELVTAQLAAVFDDIPVEAVKIGLLGNAANARAVYDFLARIEAGPPVVLDPVMVSASGHAFLGLEATEALKALISLAALVTPNIPEAEALSGLTINGPRAMEEAAARLIELGPESVMIKGGHGSGESSDDLLFHKSGQSQWLRGPRLATKNNHGTGCTLSSAIAANLALGLDLTTAATLAKRYVTAAMENSLNLGHGPGPLNHFHEYYNFSS